MGLNRLVLNRLGQVTSDARAVNFQGIYVMYVMYFMYP